jgi:hypothetical protein
VFVPKCLLEHGIGIVHYRLNPPSGKRRIRGSVAALIAALLLTAAWHFIVAGCSVTCAGVSMHTDSYLVAIGRCGQRLSCLVVCWFLVLCGRALYCAGCSVTCVCVSVHNLLVVAGSTFA